MTEFLAVKGSHIPALGTFSFRYIYYNVVEIFTGCARVFTYFRLVGLASKEKRIYCLLFIENARREI